MMFFYFSIYRIVTKQSYRKFIISLSLLQIKIMMTELSKFVIFNSSLTVKGIGG